MISLGDGSISAPFGATEDVQRWQIVRLYAKQNLDRAALKLAGADERLRGESSINLMRNNDDAEIDKAKARFNSLSARSNIRQSRSQVEMLALLSVSAEKIGEIEKAIEFEIARRNLSRGAAERGESEKRIMQLKAKAQERRRKQTPFIDVNESAVTVR
jgi:hypothetical protein